MSTGTTTEVRRPARSLTAALALAPALSYADRFGYLPLATALGDPAAAAGSVTAYLIAYGVSQPFWGTASDRYGRRQVLGAGLLLLAVANGLTALVPAPPWAILTRGVAGLASGALLPTTLALIGDLWPAQERHVVVSRTTATASLAASVATLGAGIGAELLGWRVTIGLFAVLALLGLAGPAALPAAGRPAAGPPRWTALRQAGPQGARLYGFAFVEGAVMLGTFPLLAPLLRSAGGSTLVAGATTAAYGVAAVAGARIVPVLERRRPGSAVLVGGLLLIGGNALVAWVPTAPLLAGAVASAALGAAFTLFHGRLQALATQLVPAARGLGTGLFVGMVFTGAALGTWAADRLTASRGLGVTAIATVLVSIAVTVTGRRLLAPGSDRGPAAQHLDLTVQP
ncbi:MAG: MFS transporter [Actinobacteria bacterium]|nr:MFS transporter [Actinomycetota bacterium]